MLTLTYAERPPGAKVRCQEPGLEALLGGDPPGLDGVSEGLVVTLVLLGVGVGELDERAIEARCSLDLVLECS